MNPEDEALSDEQLEEMFDFEIDYSERPRFMLDENADFRILDDLPPEIDVTIVQDYDLTPEQRELDNFVLSLASHEGRIFVTVDRDYYQIKERLLGLGITYAGILHLDTNTSRNNPAFVQKHILLIYHEDRPDSLQNGYKRI